MQSILNALFDGKMIPNARTPENSQEKDEAAQEWERLLSAWQDAHDQEERLALDRILSAHNYLGYFSDRSAFVYGFRLGALLMLDVTMGKETLIRE